MRAPPAARVSGFALPVEPVVTADREASSSRVRYLESLRGIAACIVVVAHFAAAFHPCVVFGQRCAPAPVWEPAVWSLPLGIVVASNAAVCFFFVLSGYVLSLPFMGQARDRADLLGALLKRPLRLGGLVVATEGIAVGLWSLGAFANAPAAAAMGGNEWFAHYWSADPGQQGLPWSLLTMPVLRSDNVFNPPLWTITIELFGSIQVFLFLLLFRDSRYRPLIAAAFLVLFAPTPYAGFWIGLSFAELTQRRLLTAHSLGPGSALALLVAGAWLCAFPWYLDADHLANTIWWWFPRTWIYGAPCLLGATLVFAAVLGRERLQAALSAGWLTASGNLSYAIYAAHFLVLGSATSLVFLFASSALGGVAGLVLAFAANTLLIWGVALVLARWVDAPVTRFANRFGSAVARAIRAGVSALPPLARSARR
jgi:peptidoglycan/LPS O-acetylase OafA/YrhL